MSASFVGTNSALLLTLRARSKRACCDIGYEGIGNGSYFGRDRLSLFSIRNRDNQYGTINRATKFHSRMCTQNSNDDDEESGNETNNNRKNPIDVVAGRGFQASFEENLEHLLPLLSQEETEVDEETQAMRDFVDLLSDQYLSDFRKSPQTKNLRPFAIRSNAQKICAECDGIGEITCKYCNGDGFIVMDGEFNPHFDGWVLEPPKHVVANYYHCPLCGGRRTHRCEECAGCGLEGGMSRLMRGLPLDGVENLPEFAASDQATRTATEMFDEDKFLEQFKDRIEYAPNGIIIVRAKKKRSGRKPKKKEPQQQAEAKVTELTVNGKRKRGRPRKQVEPKLKPQQQKQHIEQKRAIVDLENGERFRENLLPGKARPTKRKSRRSTDFLNTTDFKVGKRLSDDDDDNDDELSSQRNKQD